MCYGLTVFHLSKPQIPKESSWLGLQCRHAGKKSTAIKISRSHHPLAISLTLKIDGDGKAQSRLGGKDTPTKQGCSVKQSLRTLFLPLLNLFESDKKALPYKKSHRTTLIIVGSLFVLLSLATTVGAYFYGQLSAALPILIFSALGSKCLIVSTLGTDNAVAKI